MAFHFDLLSKSDQILLIIPPPQYVDADSIERLVATILNHQLLLAWKEQIDKKQQLWFQKIFVHPSS